MFEETKDLFYQHSNCTELTPPGKKIHILLLLLSRKYVKTQFSYQKPAFLQDAVNTGLNIEWNFLGGTVLDHE